MANDLYLKSTNAKLDPLEADNIDELQRKMNECNKNGHYPIHESAFKGYANAVRRFVEHSKDKYDQLELTTKDEMQSTPILLAALGSNIEIVKLLYELGAKVDVQNANGHTIVEIAAFRQDIKLLNYLISIDYGDLNVWKRLLGEFMTDYEETSASIGRTLEKITEIPKSDEYIDEWKTRMESLLENELLDAILRVLNFQSVECVLSAFFILINLYEYIIITKKFEIIENFIKYGGLGIFYKMLQLNSFEQLIYDESIVSMCGKIFEKFSKVPQVYSIVFGSLSLDSLGNIILSILRLIKKIPEPNLLYSFLNFLSNLIETDNNSPIQTATTLNNKTLYNHGAVITSLISLYKISTEKTHYFYALLNLTHVMCKYSIETQTQFIKEGLTAFLLFGLRHDSHEIKELTISCTRTCSAENIYVQRVLLKDSVLPTLVTLLHKTQILHLKMLIINTLWAIAGDDPLQRKNMAVKIRINYLVDFLSLKSDDLYYIACEALRVLFTIPASVNQSIHDQFINLHGVNALTRALTNENEKILISVIRCIQRFCVRTGLVPFRNGQNEIKKFDGITFLVALYLHAPHDIVRVESAIALSYLCLDNQQNLEITLDTLNFKYNALINLAKSKDNSIQLLARTALAFFGFNNLSQLRTMSNIENFIWSNFENILKMNSNKNDEARCECAFQAAILAPLITDIGQANASAYGIQVLINLLNNEFSTMYVKILAAEKLAILAKLKSDGVSEAIVAADGVKILCNNLYSENEILQGVCAIALSNYTYCSEGRRKLLYRCRHDSSILECLKFYNEYQNSKHRLSPQFYEDWQHYISIGLPVNKSTSKSRLESVIDKQGKRLEIASINEARGESVDPNEIENDIRVESVL